MKCNPGKLCKRISIAILLVIVLLYASIAVPKLLGYEVYYVISGSMEPAIPIGSAVYTMETAPEGIAAGDVIAFTDSVTATSVVTHRVVSNDTTAKEVTTKGDANESTDFMPVAYQNILGRVQGSIPIWGYVAAFFTTVAGKIMAASLIAVAVILNFLGSTWQKNAQAEKSFQAEKTLQAEKTIPVEESLQAEKSLQAGKTSQAGKKRFTMLILILGIVLVAVAGWNVYRIFAGYHKTDALYAELETFYVTEHAESESAWYQQIEVDWEALSKVNPDVIGWLYFENEDISYPILYSGDDETYLRTAMDGTKATAGSIFMEGANHPDFEDSHTIVYGHNMRNLSMFGKLRYYRNEADYYDTHQYFQILVGDKKYRYRIFAYEDVAEDSFVYQVPFAPGTEFESFLQQIYASSYVDTQVEATSQDKIVTLSTCSTTGKRFVVHGVRVDEWNINK